MGAPFSDITLYIPTVLSSGTAEYVEERSLLNYISDLYVQKMYGYKPPKTSRICVQPDFHGKWKKPWKFGSIANVAPPYNYEEYTACNRKGKYMYALDCIQRATLELTEEFNWDKSVFETAYQEVLECDFKFRIEYPGKQTRDKKKSGKLFIEKTETITSVLVNIESNGSIIAKKLFDKKNEWWYDSAYILARFSKWIDSDKFGIDYRKGRIESWYSIKQDKVMIFENGKIVNEIEFKKEFFLE